MKFNHLALALLLFSNNSCATKESQTTNSAATKSTNTTVSTTPAKSVSDDNRIQEMGILKQVEDAGYPFANLTIEFPERKFTEEFTINLEAVKGAQLATISTWVGRFVSFAYTSELENALLDIQVDGKSLLDDNAGNTTEAKKIEGILKGADEETPGDLPGTIAITSTDQGTQSFSFFITKEMVAANGSSVVGYYEERTQNNITSIKLCYLNETENYSCSMRSL